MNKIDEETKQQLDLLKSICEARLGPIRTSINYTLTAAVALMVVEMAYALSPGGFTGNKSLSYWNIAGIGNVIGPTLAGIVASISNIQLSLISASLFAILMAVIAATRKMYSER